MQSKSVALCLLYQLSFKQGRNNFYSPQTVLKNQPKNNYIFQTPSFALSEKLKNFSSIFFIYHSKSTLQKRYKSSW